MTSNVLTLKMVVRLTRAMSAPATGPLGDAEVEEAIRAADADDGLQRQFVGDAVERALRDAGREPAWEDPAAWPKGGRRVAVDVGDTGRRETDEALRACFAELRGAGPCRVWVSGYRVVAEA